MIVKNSIDEIKKRENALKIIRTIIKNNGRNSLYDLTGLSGGFILEEGDLNLLETYVGPAIFEEKLNELGKKHLGGEKVLAVNRTSSGILATILSLVKENDTVVHFLAEFPSHPSITRAIELVKGNYLEFDDLNKFHIPKDTSLLIITGSTMDHKVLDEETFKKVISAGKERNIPVFVDDASGARLRTVIYKQKRAIDLGADLVVTSTDKLMPGPRGGLMAGTTDLINQIKSKAHQFGLEAQPPSIVAMVNGLKAFTEDNLLNSIDKKNKLLELLKDYNMFKETPTGLMVDENTLKSEIEHHTNDKNNINSNLSSQDLCFIWAMILLKNHSIITIPAVSMPGASPTVRFDLSSKDATDLDMNQLKENIDKSFKELLETIDDLDKCNTLLFGN
jgi:L-seryl-tRNA(Ser) seleniumtransferase